MAMKAIVGQQFKLGQHDILIGFGHIFLMGALQGQDHVGLGARGEIKCTLVAADAFIAFLAHVIGHDHHRRVTFEQANIGSTNAKISRARANNAFGAGA